MKRLLGILVCMSILCMCMVGCNQRYDSSSSEEISEIGAYSSEIVGFNSRSFPAMAEENGKNTYLDTPFIISSKEEFDQFFTVFMGKIERYKYFFEVDTAREYLEQFDNSFFKYNSLLVCRTVCTRGGFYADIRDIDLENEKMTVKIKRCELRSGEKLTSLDTHVLFAEIGKSTADGVKAIELVVEEQEIKSYSSTGFKESKKLEYTWEVYGGNLEGFVPCDVAYSTKEREVKTSVGLITQIHNMEDWERFYSRYSYNGQFKNLQDLNKTLDENYFKDNIIVAVPMTSEKNGVKYSMRDVKYFKGDYDDANKEGIYFSMVLNERLSDDTKKKSNALMIIHLNKEDVPENPYLVNYVNFMT